MLVTLVIDSTKGDFFVEARGDPRSRRKDYMGVGCELWCKGCVVGDLEEKET